MYVAKSWLFEADLEFLSFNATGMAQWPNAKYNTSEICGTKEIQIQQYAV